MISDDISIVVVEIRGDKVRLGIEAPKEIPVHRREVYDTIRANQQASAAQAANDYVQPEMAPPSDMTDFTKGKNDDHGN